MTKGETVIAALMTRLAGKGGLEAIYDSRILENSKDKKLYAVITETGEQVAQASGQSLMPLRCTMGVVVALIAVGGDSDEIRFEASALSNLRAAQSAVEAELIKAHETLGGELEKLNYTGARVMARGEGDTVSIVRELNFDAVYWREEV